MRRLTLVLPLLVLALFIAAAQTPAQQEVTLKAISYHPQPTTTIRTDTNLVDIGVVVRDAKGHAVSGLTKADFQVRDDNKDREITSFTVTNFAPAASTAKAASAPAAAIATPAAAPGQPRFVGLVFEDINTPNTDLNHAKVAAKRFLKEGLGANDRVGIFTTSAFEVLPFTRDVGKISEAIDNVKARDGQARTTTCPLLSEYDSYLIANDLDPTDLRLKATEYNNCAHACTGKALCVVATTYVQSLSNALWTEIQTNTLEIFKSLGTIVNYMATLPGNRVMLLASSGFISHTLEAEEDRLTERALRANVVINSLDARGLYTQEFEVGQGANPESIQRQHLSSMNAKSDASDAMVSLASSTGGLMFENNNDLNLGFRELGMQPEVSYLLAISPDVLDTKYHHLKINLTNKAHLTVQARKGYVASPRTPAAPPVQRRLDTEVFTTNQVDDAPVKVFATPETTPDGKQMARLTFHVDISRAQFHEQDGARRQQYRMVAAFLDANGQFVTGVEAMLQLALKPETFSKGMNGGLNADMRMDVPVGAYRMRTVVVEGDDNGRYAIATQPVVFK
jgi:VWFA-related protein